MAGIPFSIESFQKQLNIHIDREKLLLYNVSFNTLLHTLKCGLKTSEVTTLRSYQQLLPIVIGSNDEDLHRMLSNTLISTEAVPKWTMSKEKDHKVSALFKNTL